MEGPESQFTTTQTQKPTRVRHAVHKDQTFDSNMDSEGSDGDRPRGTDGKRPLTTRQAVLASVVGLSWTRGCVPSFTGYGSLSCVWVFPTGYRSMYETLRKRKWLNEAEITLRQDTKR